MHLRPGAVLAGLSDRWRPVSNAWTSAGALLAVVVMGAVLFGPDSPPEPPGAALASSSPTTTSSDPVLQAAMERIADAVKDPGVIAPDLAAEIIAIDSTSSGWLLLVGTDELYPDDAHAVCQALSDADALPDLRVFVADSRRHLVRGC